MTHTTLIACAFFSICFTIQGTKNNNNLHFEELDQCIKNHSVYEKAKIVQINSIRKLLNSSSSFQQTFTIYFHLYQEYKAFNYDSAYAYANKMLLLAQALKEPSKISCAKMALSFSCRSGGLYKEAHELLYSINPNTLNDHDKAILYAFRSSFNRELAEFFRNEPFSSQYYAESYKYCKLAASTTKFDDVSICSARSWIYAFQKNYKEAIRISLESFKTKKPDEHDYAMLAADISRFFIETGDTIQAMQYCIRSSIADIKSATKETTSIRILAEWLYKQKDYQHAHSYIMQALDDANFYNARQRKIEVSSILPIIETERFEGIKQQKNNLQIYSILLSALVMMLLIAIYIIRKQTRKLNSARLVILKQNEDLLASNNQLTEIQKKISHQNHELLQINDKLMEAHRIKEEYIGYFFNANSIFIEKLEEYRKVVNRKLKAKQYDELLQINNTSDIHQERENMFVLFDHIFLKLFPDFVSQYNLLFNNEDRVILKSGEILTTEVRIFALIRLGITESERIAKFLDYSVHTVNNYKTRAKNRSVASNEFFEQKIMEIESVKIRMEE